MTTTQRDIRSWLDNAKEEGATHMIVVCDSFDYEDYPVNVMPEEDVNQKVKEYKGKPMQRIMEVYALHLDINTQLEEHRAYHLENPPNERPTKTTEET